MGSIIKKKKVISEQKWFCSSDLLDIIELTNKIIRRRPSLWGKQMVYREDREGVLDLNKLFSR